MKSFLFCKVTSSLLIIKYEKILRVLFFQKRDLESFDNDVSSFRNPQNSFIVRSSAAFNFVDSTHMLCIEWCQALLGEKPYDIMPFEWYLTGICGSIARLSVFLSQTQN